MAKQRRKTGNTEVEAIVEVDGSGYATDTNTNAVERTHKMAGLTADQIQTLLGKTRQKGLYVERINTFIDSGEMGTCVNEQWVDFADKKDSTLKQGFEGAKDKKEAREGADQVKVISSEGKVYLVNLTVAGEQLGTEAVAA